MRPAVRRLAYAALITGFLLIGSDAAFAQATNPVGQWQASAFNDPTPNLTPLATQTLCFRANGTWFGTFPGWRGSWFQKGANAAGNGNRVRILGNFLSGGNTGAGNDSAEFDFINSNLMTGPWNEWIDVALNGSTAGFWLRISATRTSNACTIAPVPPATFGPNEEQRMPWGTPDATGLEGETGDS